MLSWKHFQKNYMKKIIFLAILSLVLVGAYFPTTILAKGILFNIDSSYDISARENLEAVSVKTTSKLYLYIEADWWNSRTYSQKANISEMLDDLSAEFENKIYPKLTSTFGEERKPGIDGDEKITILFHRMKEGVGGYFRNVDEYLKFQAPYSNEREMFYVSSSHIGNPKLGALVAHEFTHLITFNQKDKINNVSEEIWLNEARAEYAPTLIGYDSEYQGSNLESRVDIFLENPSDSITEWRGKKYDYGALNLFIQYLVDHYGIEILADSLKSREVGIPSLNEALVKNGFEENFHQIFTDWTIAVLVNDCSLGEKYCYLNENLKDLKIVPTLNFLPLSGKSSLTVTNLTKNWSGNWQKFIGGSGILKLEFEALAGLNFRIPYLTQDEQGNYSIGFMELDENQLGEIYVPDFNSENKTLFILPSLQTKTIGFNGNEGTYPFTFKVSIVKSAAEQKQEQELIEKLLAQISYLQAEIAKVQAKINTILEERHQNSFQEIKSDLYFGLTNNSEVKFLQNFLKFYEKEIYPEGLVTGNFFSLTQRAVIEFQEKYAEDVLYPLNLEKGTGFVGKMTRSKINEILNKNI
jgi:hypothetical protein